jgi:hypothetical protein|tara:strand:+ start:251 stop:547 length:297 start_codon:yes stop_codon:yes gene_type:complete
MKAFSEALKAVNEHPLSTALAMLVLNIGSKYVEMRFSLTQEQLIRDNLGMEILIGAVLFTATKDLLLSVFLTMTVVLLTDFFLNEKSRFCVYHPKSCR